MTKSVALSDLHALVGTRTEPSNWLEITQERIDRFADATDDHQFIHVDPERARHTPFGGTIAHGYLTLSLLPALTSEQLSTVEGVAMAVNYGSNKVRFLQPVRSGDRIRARQRFLEVTERQPGQYLLRSRVTLEIEGQEKPAMIAEILALLIAGPRQE